jgi:hypothetical protein
MKNERMTLAKKEYDRLKKRDDIDAGLLKQLLESFKDIKSGRVKRVK